MIRVRFGIAAYLKKSSFTLTSSFLSLASCFFKDAIFRNLLFSASASASSNVR
jgi:hypothetical protein